MDNAKSYHVAAIYVGLWWLMTITPEQGRWSSVFTSLLSFGFLWAASFIVTVNLRRRWRAHRLRRISGEAGSEGEEGYDIDWMQRPL